MTPLDQNRQTPVYNPSFDPRLSPREMWKEPEKEKPAPKPSPVEQPEQEEFNRCTFKELTDDERNLMCAGIVLSKNYRKFLKPWLESFTHPPRRKVRSEADKYQLLEDNNNADFAQMIIDTLEGRAKRSPSYQYVQEE